MSTNPNVPPSGAPLAASTSFDPIASSAGSPLSGPAPGDDQASYPRDSGASVPAPRPDIPRNDPSFPDASQPPPWTDEDFVRYAEARFGHKFTPSAARAFSEFDPNSHDVQAAEFYRYVDEHFKRFGYF